MERKAISLGEAFPAVLAVALVSILLVAVIYLFTQFGSTFDTGSAAANATGDLTTQFSNAVPLIGLVLTIVLIAIVIGVLITAFYMRSSGGRV